MGKTRLVVLGAEVALLAALASLSLLSHTGALGSYVVLSSSMEPGLPRGALAVTAPVGTGGPAVGDVVAYGAGSSVVLHRVQAVGEDGSVTTKGDANDDVDPVAVGPDAVKGRLLFSVPLLGAAVEAMGGHRVAVMGAVALFNLVLCAVPSRSGALIRGRPVVG